MLTNDTWFMYENGKMNMLGADAFGSLSAEGDKSVTYENIGADVPVWEVSFKKPDNADEQFIQFGEVVRLDGYFMGLAHVTLASKEETFIDAAQFKKNSKKAKIDSEGSFYEIMAKLPIYTMHMKDSYKIPNGRLFKMSENPHSFGKYIQFDKGKLVVLKSDVQDPKHVKKAVFLGDDGGTSSSGDHVLDCHKLPQTKFCQRHSASPICIGRIKRCEKHNAKLDNLRGEAAQASGLAKTLNTDADETAAETAKASSATGSDNTMTYVAVGGVIFVVLAGAAFMLLGKKGGAAPVAAVASPAK